MKYRKFGRMGWEVSVLGFGCMRLPTLGSPAEIDEPEAIKMIRYAIDHGVNYFDNGYGYHGGNSERVLGKALKDGYREKVILATKLPPPHVQTADDFDRLFNEQLEKLQVDYLDVYLLHGLRLERWEKLRDLGIISWAEQQMAKGRFRAFGFSFHDNLDAFKTIVDAYDNWAMCQVQYNFMDVKHQAGTEGVRYAAYKGLAVVAMEPILGGRLANPPEVVQKLWDSAPVKRTPAEWALQWVWNQPEVTVALSGMSNMQQLMENIASAERSGVGSLKQAELELIDRVREAYQGLCPVPCTACEYCMPCPNGVNIPRNFRMFNEAIMYNQLEQARRGYLNRMPEAERASACIQCRRCEELCPQRIIISERLVEVDEVLGQGKPYVRSTS